MNGRNINLRRRIEDRLDSDIAVCSTVKSELFYGAMKSNNPSRTLALQKAFLSRFISLPFDDEAAEIFGDIRAKLTKIGLTHKSRNNEPRSRSVPSGIGTKRTKKRGFERYFA
ncbi:MAG: type II toxin-antitoxin system VapC family toxin [Dolichospermum sp.]